MVSLTFQGSVKLFFLSHPIQSDIILNYLWYPILSFPICLDTGDFFVWPLNLIYSVLKPLSYCIFTFIDWTTVIWVKVCQSGSIKYGDIHIHVSIIIYHRERGRKMCSVRLGRRRVKEITQTQDLWHPPDKNLNSENRFFFLSLNCLDPIDPVPMTVSDSVSALAEASSREASKVKHQRLVRSHRKRPVEETLIRPLYGPNRCQAKALQRPTTTTEKKVRKKF